ncbi:MAG: BON domain-containing protein [Planctomycetes bacterium]|nr:BON domain-containing protein [Planctomycetota bacterium]
MAALAIALASSAADVAQAQSSGAFGARSMGSSFSPAASSFGGTRSTAAGGMPSGFGGVSGMGGGVAGATQRGDTTAGQVTGNERFVRGARQPGQFVGSDAGDSNNFFSQLSSYASQQQRRGNNDNSNPNRQSGMSGGNSRRVQPRVEQSIAFDFAPPKPELVDAALQSRFKLSPRFAKLGAIEVTMVGRTAVLSGVVATEHDRALAAQLASLEAGVSEVRNDLTIAAGPAAPAVVPPVAAPPAIGVPPAANP